MRDTFDDGQTSLPGVSGVSSATTGAANRKHGLDLEVQVGHLLRRAYAKAKKNSIESLRPLGEISPIQAAAIVALSGGGLTQAELGRRIGMESANVHSFVRRLEAAGFVHVENLNGSSRAAGVALTLLGTSLVERLGPAARISAQETLQRLSEQERAVFLNLLRKISL